MVTLMYWYIYYFTVFFIITPVLKIEKDIEENEIKENKMEVKEIKEKNTEYPCM
jgi:hypothetical protein